MQVKMPNGEIKNWDLQKGLVNEYMDQKKKIAKKDKAKDIEVKIVQSKPAPKKSKKK